MKKIILLLVLLISFNTLCNSQNKKQLSEREEDSLYIDYCARFVNSYMTYSHTIATQIRNKYQEISMLRIRIPEESIEKYISIYLKYKGGICDDFNNFFIAYLRREKIKNLEIYNLILENSDKGILVPFHAATIIRFYENWYYFDTTGGLYWLKYIPSDYKIFMAFAEKGKHRPPQELYSYFN